MKQAWFRLGFVCAFGLALGCSSSPGQKPDGGETVDAPLSRGETYVLIPDAADGRDSAADRDAASDKAEAGDGGDASDAGDAVEVSDVADAADAVDAAPDLPVEKPSNLGNGQPCQDNSWCRSKFCVDNVCCNTACEGQDPNRCNGCSMATTGQRDGVCAPDKTRENMKCGEACGNVAMNEPAVFAMVCVSGTCKVPAAPMVVGDPCRSADMCTVSFCDQPTNRTARCVDTLCPTMGTCCCEQPGNAAQRSCVTTTTCKNDRACVAK